MRPLNSYIRGFGYEHWVYGFESTVAESVAGNDKATIYGSDGNDVFTGGPITSRYQGEGFDFQLTNFPTILVFGNGGDDRSNYVAGTETSDFYFSTQLTQVATFGNLITTIGFNQFTYDGGTGTATARLIAGIGEDQLTLSNSETVLQNNDYEIRLSRIDDLFAVATTDNSDDTIEFLDDSNELEFSFDYVGDWFVI